MYTSHHGKYLPLITKHVNLSSQNMIHFSNQNVLGTTWYSSLQHSLYYDQVYCAYVLVHRHPAVGTSSSNEGLSVKKGPATNNWTQTRACVSDRIRSNLFIYLVKHLVRINSPFQEILVSIAGGYKLFILRVRLYKVKYKEKYLVLLVLGHD